jgi:hypothetical protein
MRGMIVRVGICSATLLLFAAGCDDSDGSKVKLDGGGSEAGRAIDASDSAKDVSQPGTDARDVRPLGDAPLPDGPGPALDGPTVVRLDGAQAEPGRDGGTVEPADAPLGNEADTGSAIGIDGPHAETGTLPPLVYPDGGLACGQAGAVCQSAADCCGLACIANRCAAAACLSDGTTCTTGGECCGTVCGADGKCKALNPTCKTAGNACQTGSECCSGTCNTNKQCAQPGQVSYCAQAGDICRGDSDCCTGVCNAAAGAAAGTCATLTTTSNCQIDGTVCNGCGTCCSHFCGSFGAGGPHICQPASGCHVQGDLCRKDSDCCGGDATSGLPGAGLVKCEPDPVYGGRIGSCGGPKAGNCPNGVETCKNSCNPEGNICHYKDTSVCAGDTTSKRNDCCACISGKECCKLDSTGIPRCNALTACVPAGGNCSFSDECCNHLPCVPDAVTGKLTCGSTCVPQGRACTTNADCCIGTLCEVTPGALAGVCIIPTPPPVVIPDGGTVEPDAAAALDVAPPPVCAYFGQGCSLTVTCCGGIPCVNDQFYDCTASDTSCICLSTE